VQSNTVSSTHETLTSADTRVDPVFFLHHTQLDRLWWHWQSISPGRNQDYKGPASQGSHELANINDELDVGQLAPVVKVSEVLDPAFGSLCYGY
jgi:tyrosinase